MIAKHESMWSQRQRDVFARQRGSRSKLQNPVHVASADEMTDVWVVESGKMGDQHMYGLLVTTTTPDGVYQERLDKKSQHLELSAAVARCESLAADSERLAFILDA